MLFSKSFIVSSFKRIDFFNRNIITCGADGDYRVWKGYEDDDPECVRVGDEATCVSFKVSYLLCVAESIIRFTKP